MKRGADWDNFGERAYAMKKHDATRLHYDLRLEWNGVLLSWALPEGPCCHAGVAREAIEMEDHRRAYLLFEGVHETGTIMLWDCGTWTPHQEDANVDKALRRGILRFTLRGEKLRGGWTLKRIRIQSERSRAVWTLTRDADAFAESCAGRSILEEQPNSISGKTMEQIVLGWEHPKAKHLNQLSLFGH